MNPLFLSLDDSTGIYLPAELTLGLDEEQSSEIIKVIVSWGIIDILEVSGGTYATPGKIYPFYPNPFAH